MTMYSLHTVRARPIHYGLVSNHVGHAVFAWGMRMLYPDHSQVTEITPAGDSKQLFWSVWHRECALRKKLQHTRGSWEKCVDSMGRVNGVIQHCPVRWVRELPQLSRHMRTADLREKGTWVYAAYRPKYGLRYWGQTGAKTEPRSLTVSDRCYEEVRDALKCYKLYGSKGIRGPPYIPLSTRIRGGFGGYGCPFFSQHLWGFFEVADVGYLFVFFNSTRIY